MHEEMFTAREISDLSAVAKRLIELAIDYPLLLFHGEMGSGKTTLIKEICAQKGVTERVSSPTFSLVNEYHATDGRCIYHFDLHRIEEMEELLDFGFEDYIDSGDLCLIEWPEVALPLLPKERIEIRISEHEQVREIRVKTIV